MTPSGISLVVDSGIWNYVKERLLKPSYSRLKRFNMLHERNVPCIYSSTRVISDFSYEFLHTELPNNSNLRPLLHQQCEKCWDFTFVIDVNRGIQICKRCKHVIDENVSNKASFVDSHGPPLNSKKAAPLLPRSHTNSFYKRINHFKTWITRLRGEPIRSITQEEIQELERLFKSYNLPSPSFDQVRYVLRTHGFQHQYNNTFYIMRLISGRSVFEFSDVHANKLIERFRTIHETFTVSRGNRVNMLSYIYLIKKFCELEGWDHVAQALPAIKCQEKLYSQDMIWKEVCRRHGYKFIRSV